MADEIQFDWDDANTAHLARHGITTAEAEQVFQNGYAVLDEQNVNGEQRFSVVGYTNAGRPLTILATLRAGAVRPFTGWNAELEEEEFYWAERGV